MEIKRRIKSVQTRKAWPGMRQGQIKSMRLTSNNLRPQNKNNRKDNRCIEFKSL